MVRTLDTKGFLTHKTYGHINVYWDQDIYYINNHLHTLEVSVQKSFLKDDALTVRLAGTDLMNGNRQHILADYGCFTVDQTNDLRAPGITLRVSYRLNSANDKYKGTGAGQDAKSRM